MMIAPHPDGPQPAFTVPGETLLPMANRTMCVAADVHNRPDDPGHAEGYVLCWTGREWVTWFAWKDAATNGLWETTGGVYIGSSAMRAQGSYDERRGLCS